MMILIIYHHAIYPALLRRLAQHKKDKRSDIATAIKTDFKRCYEVNSDDEYLPEITLILPAFNEEETIAAKMANLACLDYPAEKLFIVIGCDGCTDNTLPILLHCLEQPELKHLNVKVNNFEQNRGKIAVINELINQSTSPIVGLSDISALLSIDALSQAAIQFTDPTIGVLTSQYQLTPGCSTGEKSYWQYQSSIKYCEAALGATMGVHGALYFFRRTLFTPLASDTINDDFMIPMQIVQQGYQAAYNTEINALELEVADTSLDHLRRRRIAAGNLQQLWRLKAMLIDRKQIAVAFNFLSGKALRCLMPFLFILTFIASAWLSINSPLFMGLFILQIIGYVMCIFSCLYADKIHSELFKTLAYIASGYTANLIGSVRYLLKLDKGHWTKS